MALYWQLKSVPELRELPENVRLQTWTIARRRVASERLSMRFALDFGPWIAFGFMLAVMNGLERHRGGSWPPYPGLVPGETEFWVWVLARSARVLVIGIVVVGVYAIVARPLAIARTRPYIREYLTAGT